MRYPVLVLSALALALPASSEAQSLAEAARKERQRREERKTGAADAEVRSYGNDDLRGEDDAAPDAEPDPSREPEPGEMIRVTEEDLEKQAARREAGERRLQAGRDSARRDRQRRSDEANWRRAAEEARARIDAAKRDLEAIDELWLVQGERYVDDQGQTVIRDLDHLRELKKRAQEEVAAAEQAMAELRTRARREGVPPGWLR